MGKAHAAPIGEKWIQLHQFTSQGTGHWLMAGKDIDNGHPACLKACVTKESDRSVTAQFKATAAQRALSTQRELLPACLD